MPPFNVVMVTHFHTSGESPPVSDLEAFFTNRTDSLLTIYHAMPSDSKLRSFSRLYERPRKYGVVIDESFGLPPIKPEFASYFKDVIFTIRRILACGKRFSLYIGFDGLNTMVGLLLRSLGIVEKVVFYTIDFVPVRFPNRILNILYHMIDKISVKYSDCVWNLTRSMEAARRKRGLLAGRNAPTIVVPIGMNLQRIRDIRKASNDPKRLVYAGYLDNSFGVQLILEAVARLSNEIPNLELLITGTGPLDKNLNHLIRKLGIEKHVKFMGFLESHKELERLISTCGVGLAIYSDSPLSYKRYADASKVKLYMACGLPVITTDVPPIAEEIKAHKAGLVIRYDLNELVKAILLMTSSYDIYRKLKQNAIRLVADYDWNAIFSRALIFLIHLQEQWRSTQSKD